MKKNKIIVVLIMAILILSAIIVIILNHGQKKSFDDFNSSDVSDDDYITLDNGDKVYFPEVKDVVPDYTENTIIVNSNININVDEYKNFDFMQDWFIFSESDLSINTVLLSALAYSLNEYYNGIVPCEYSFDSSIDTIDMVSNMCGTFRINSLDSRYSSFEVTIDFVDDNINIKEFD